MICFVLRELHRGVALVSVFKFQVSSLKLIFEIVLELVVNVKSSEVENYRKDFTQSYTEFFLICFVLRELHRDVSLIIIYYLVYVSFVMLKAKIQRS